MVKVLTEQKVKYSKSHIKRPKADSLQKAVPRQKEIKTTKPLKPEPNHVPEKANQKTI